MLSPVRLSDCCLSVTFVSPTQPVDIFGNVSTPSGTLTSTENFYGMVAGKPLRREGGSYARGVDKYSDFGLIEGYISETAQHRR